MILTALELENFRQFAGRQRIELEASGDRNVTVIYGANGAGKTTLLNAFTWALYQAFTPGFEQPERLINEGVWDDLPVGGEVSASVTLEFEHEGRRYTVRRVTTDRKNADASGVRLRNAAPSVGFIDADGEHHDRDSTFEGTVNEVLPERLHRFFFFDGERIEQLVKSSAYTEIEQAIKVILGLAVVERAIKHTDEAHRALQRELADLGSDEDRQLEEQLAELRERRDGRVEDLAQLQANRAALEDEQREVDAQLAQLKEAAELQRRRERLETDLAAASEAVRATRQTQADLIARSGWMTFCGTLSQRTQELYADQRQRGQIPSDMKLQFVEDLLESGQCICGCGLTPGEEPYEKVAAWKERAVDANVEAAWVRLPALSVHVRTGREDVFRQLHESMATLRRQRDARQRIDDELSTISDSLRGNESETVAALEDRREALRASVREADRRTMRAEDEIADLNHRERDLDRKLDEARAENQRADLARRRVRAARGTSELFREILHLRTEDIRCALDMRIKELYSQISFKNYVPALDSSFRLDLRNGPGEDATPVAKSTGENQILSLSFVGALAEHARERQRESEDGSGDGLLSFQGGIFPVVMDSPFGSLDLNYQERIADAIPRLAPQVVLFVSRSQGLSAVQQIMSARIHREYVLEFHTPKEDLEPEEIELRSGAYPYIVRSAGTREFARLEAVR